MKTIPLLYVFAHIPSSPSLQGDGNVRYFELVDEEPYVYLLAEHRTNVSTKARIPSSLACTSR